MSKQDRQGVRTPADLERKYNFGKTFAEFAGMVEETQEEAEQAAEDVTELDQKLNFDELFRRLTADGRNPGMYIDKETGLVVFNCDYLKSGTIIGDLIKAGVIRSKDGENVVIDLDNGTADITGNITTRSVDDGEGNVYHSALTPSGVYIGNDGVSGTHLTRSRLQFSSDRGRVLIQNAWSKDNGSSISLRDDSLKNRLELDVTPEGSTDAYSRIWLYSSNHIGTNGMNIVCTPAEVYIRGLTAPVDDSDAVNKQYVDSNFAPAGYGYGGAAINLGSVKSEDALNTALATVYDAMAGTETKMVTWTYHPLSSDWRWFGILSRSSANNGSLIAHSAYGGGSKIIKQKYSGSWTPCEWENPQMWADTEYRTTARYEGQPVYVKFIKYQFSGTIGSSSSYADYWIDHGITGWGRFIKVEANMGGVYFLPYLASQGGVTQIMEANSTQLRLRIYHDTWTTPNFYITMYYTKE